MPAKRAKTKKAAKPAFTTLKDSAPGATDELDVAVPFSKYGCTAHKVHKPTPASSRIARIFPARAQREVWSEIRDFDRVALCGSGAQDADYGFEALKQGKAMPRGVGLAEAAIAREGFKRYQAAKAQI